MLRRLAGRYLSQSKSNYQRSFSSQIIERNLEINRHFSPQDGYYLKSPYKIATYPELTFDQYIWKDIKNWSDKLAIICAITGRKYTYAQLRDASATLAVQLQNRYKLVKDDTIVICMHNVPEYPIIVLGSMEAGLTVTTINSKYTVNEMSRQIELCKPKVIFCLVEQYDHLENVKKSLKISIPTITIKTNSTQSTPHGAADFFELTNPKGINFSSLNKITRNLSDVCLLLFSSGTTGIPKGVMLSHLNLSSNCQAFLAKMPNEYLIAPTTPDYRETIPISLPLFHSYGLLCSLAVGLVAGAKIVTFPRFQLEEFLNICHEHKASIMYLVPHIMIMAANTEVVKKKHFESVRTIISAAAPLGALDYVRFQDKCPNTELLQAYGLTELSPVGTLPPKGCKNYATVGCVAANIELKVVNDDDPNYIGLDCGEVGQLLARGVLVMKGYYNNQKATNETITDSGWLLTGDMAYYDKDGLFYIKDRLKELIKVKGFQVPPAELEELIRNYPGVLDAVVIGISHPVNGEAPKAFIVKDKNSNLTANEIMEYVSKNVISYKRLEGGVEFIDVIPKTDSGKYLRRQLK